MTSERSVQSKLTYKQKHEGKLVGVNVISRTLTDDYRYFDEGFKKSVAEQGNANKEGIPARLGHPSFIDSKPTHFIGRYTNFEYHPPGRAGSEGYVTADLTLDDITKKTMIEGQGISTYDYITELASNNPDVFGNSIFYLPSTLKLVTAEGVALEELTDEQWDAMSWRDVYQQHDLGELLGSDLVDVPAATKGLYKDIQQASLSRYIQERPNTEHITKLKSKMSTTNKPATKPTKAPQGAKPKTETAAKKTLLDKIIDRLKSQPERLNVELTLGDGQMIEVITESENIAVGDVVLIEGEAAPAGEHLLQDGRTIVTDAEGIITEIIEAEATEEDPTDGEPAPQEQMMSQQLSAITKVIEELATQVETINKRMTAQASQISRLNKNLTGTSTPKTYAKKPEVASDKQEDYWGTALADLRVIRKEKQEKALNNA